MSFYTPGLKTHVIDSVQHHANFQTEFRFKSNTAYLTNLRLCNVGSIGTSAHYNALCGAQGIIQSIQLFDGNELLDQILEFPTWTAFSMYNQGNQVSKDMNRNLIKNTLGFNLIDTAGYEQVAQAYNAGSHGRKSKQAADLANSGKAWVSLKSLLPMLDNSVYLPTSVFKNLRLVIQYNGNKKQVVQNAAPDVTSIEPILIADEIVDPDRQRAINSQYKGVQFLAIEHDRVVLLENGTTGNEQNVTFTPAGFDNKNIHRLLMVNTPTDVGDIGAQLSIADLGSVANDNQKIQIRVNGQNKFPQNGVTRPMERLAYLTDTWGPCNSVIGCNQLNYNTSRRLASLPGSTGAAANDEVKGRSYAKAEQLNGNLDYFGCLIADFVQELQIDYSRFRDSFSNAVDSTTVNDANNEHKRHYQQQNINLFAEAHKSIAVSGGGYTISYI